jgi:hypothetical protein
MKKPLEEGLIFTLTIEEMLQQNNLMQSHFADDQAEFITKTPDLDDAFLTEWKKTTILLDDTEKDDDYIDTQLLMTQTLDESMEKGRDLLQTVFFYVERAFPGKKAEAGYFGKDRYEVARKTPLKLVELMNKCAEAASEAEYLDKLTVKGLNSQTIDDLKDTAVNIKTNFEKRDKYISNRKKITEERNQILNKIWGFMSSVSDASKLVYKNDYAKFQQYVLYKTKAKTEDANQETEQV